MTTDLTLEQAHEKIAKLTAENAELERQLKNTQTYAKTFHSLLLAVMTKLHMTQANVSLEAVNEAIKREHLVVDWRQEWQKWRITRAPREDAPRIIVPSPGTKV
jgi:hypothetical protein